ncbi:hypothetical protein COV82_06280 [Candidatus Peregrinibacteria bacterium CG11_big_fil_rev_8_21_14_0_20_46_8]|nr:MAG: hypothetical protein COV82_06280 [Candidatus Peregrinibacteria bacterium CG11_big_fil_rev_8_21_14_0_20_46_8]
MENIQNQQPGQTPQMPNMPAKPSKRPYIIGAIIAIAVLGGAVFYLMNTRTTLYKGSLPFKPAVIDANLGHAGQTSLLTSESVRIAQSDNTLESQIAELEAQLASTSDPTERRILNAQLASLRIQLASETSPAEQEPEATEEELLAEFDELIFLFTEATEPEEIDRLNEEIQNVLMQLVELDADLELAFERPDSTDLILTIEQLLKRFEGIMGQGSTDVFYDLTEEELALAANETAANETAAVDDPVVAEEFQLDPPAVDIPLEDDLLIESPIVEEPLAEEPVVEPPVAETPIPEVQTTENFTSAIIQGETGPGLALYPLSFAAAWYLRRRRKS